MTDEERQSMEKYGITYESKMVFHFQGHKYERLADALSYAERVQVAANPVSSNPVT